MCWLQHHWLCRTIALLPSAPSSCWLLRGHRPLPSSFRGSRGSLPLLLTRTFLFQWPKGGGGESSSSFLSWGCCDGHSLQASVFCPRCALISNSFAFLQSPGSAVSILWPWQLCLYVVSEKTLLIGFFCFMCRNWQAWHGLVCSSPRIVFVLSPFGHIILLYSGLLIPPGTMGCKEREEKVCSSPEICF